MVGAAAGAAAGDAAGEPATGEPAGPAGETWVKGERPGEAEPAVLGEAAPAGEAAPTVPGEAARRPSNSLPSSSASILCRSSRSSCARNLARTQLVIQCDSFDANEHAAHSHAERDHKPCTSSSRCY